MAPFTHLDPIPQQCYKGPMPNDILLPPHGGYRKLKSFQVAQLAYDVTVRFCERYVSKFSRTNDQMVQAARSGVQNIAEGSLASGTSKKTELKLTNVARASLEELKLDYEDYLRHRRLKQWPDFDPRQKSLVERRCKDVDAFVEWVNEMHAAERAAGRKTTYNEVAANGALVLITVAIRLLERQLDTLAKAFVEEGGVTERLYRVRNEYRGRHGTDSRPHPSK